MRKLSRTAAVFAAGVFAGVILFKTFGSATSLIAVQPPTTISIDNIQKSINTTALPVQQSVDPF